MSMWNYSYDYYIHGDIRYLLPDLWYIELPAKLSALKRVEMVRTTSRGLGLSSRRLLHDRSTT